MLHRVFSRQTAAELRTAAVGASLLTDDEFSALLAFTCGVYANMGNYKSFGDSKIVPDVTAERLDAFLATTDAFRSDADLARLWQRIRADIYDLSPRRQQVRFLSSLFYAKLATFSMSSTSCSLAWNEYFLLSPYSGE